MRPPPTFYDAANDAAADAKELRDGLPRLACRDHLANTQNVMPAQLRVVAFFAYGLGAVHLLLLAVLRAAQPANVVRVYADAIAAAMRGLRSLKWRSAMSEHAHATRRIHRASVDIDIPISFALSIRPRDAIVSGRANMLQKKRPRLASSSSFWDRGLIEIVTGLAPPRVVRVAKLTSPHRATAGGNSASFHKSRFTPVHTETQ